MVCARANPRHDRAMAATLPRRSVLYVRSTAADPTCGPADVRTVPQPFIVQMKALVAAMEPIQFYSCFISYSHDDKPFARALYDNPAGSRHPLLAGRKAAPTRRRPLRAHRPRYPSVGQTAALLLRALPQAAILGGQGDHHGA